MTNLSQSFHRFMKRFKRENPHITIERVEEPPKEVLDALEELPEEGNFVWMWDGKKLVIKELSSCE